MQIFYECESLACFEHINVVIFSKILRFHQRRRRVRLQREFLIFLQTSRKIFRNSLISASESNIMSDLKFKYLGSSKHRQHFTYYRKYTTFPTLRTVFERVTMLQNFPLLNIFFALTFPPLSFLVLRHLLFDNRSKAKKRVRGRKSIIFVLTSSQRSAEPHMR